MKPHGPKGRTKGGSAEVASKSARLLQAECLSALRFAEVAGPLAHSARSGSKAGSGGAVASRSVGRHLGSRHAPVVGTQPAGSGGAPGGGSAQRAREAGPFVESAELQTAERGGFLQTWADALVPGVMASVAENMVGGGGWRGSRQTEPTIRTGQRLFRSRYALAVLVASPRGGRDQSDLCPRGAWTPAQTVNFK